MRRNALAANTTAAADKLGIEYSLEHVTDVNELVNRGVILTPALAVNGTVVVAGRVPSEAELTTVLMASRADAHSL
jgi:hypothetical protein